jgi:hypothetical protein
VRELILRAYRSSTAAAAPEDPITGEGKYFVPDSCCLLDEEATEVKTEKVAVGEDGILVLKYGSDPLKTYLPDSDIDITVLCKKSCPYPLATQLPIAQLKA